MMQIWMRNKTKLTKMKKIHDKSTPPSNSTEQRPKKKRRTKPVPSDYTCMACNNKHQPLHWIYDCPDKVYKPGANKLKKRLRGIHDPSSRKVFISGLPFDAKSKDVELYFEQEKKCGKLVNCKLLQFEDTGRLREVHSSLLRLMREQRMR